MAGFTWSPDSSASAAANHGTAMSGGGSAAGFIMTAGGMGNTTGLLDFERSANYAGTVATTLLSAGAAAASGAASFSSAAGPGGTIAAVVLGAVGTAVTGGLNAWNTQKSIAALEQLSQQARMLCKDKTMGPEALLVEAIDYCIGKRGVKLAKSIADATIVGQPFNPFYKAGKAIYKKAMGTKGVNRSQYSALLMDLSKQQTKAGEIARDVVAVIVGDQYEDVARKAVENALKS